MDFKGHFRTDPFTLSDAYSRYLLRCQAVEHTDTEQVRPDQTVNHVPGLYLSRCDDSHQQAEAQRVSGTRVTGDIKRTEFLQELNTAAPACCKSGRANRVFAP
jgi:hypothetical protein